MIKLCWMEYVLCLSLTSSLQLKASASPTLLFHERVEPMPFIGTMQTPCDYDDMIEMMSMEMMTMPIIGTRHPVMVVVVVMMILMMMMMMMMVMMTIALIITRVTLGLDDAFASIVLQLL